MAQGPKSRHHSVSRFGQTTIVVFENSLSFAHLHLRTYRNNILHSLPSVRSYKSLQKSFYRLVKCKRIRTILPLFVTESENLIKDYRRTWNSKWKDHVNDGWNYQKMKPDRLVFLSIQVNGILCLKTIKTHRTPLPISRKQAKPHCDNHNDTSVINENFSKQ